MSNQLPPVQHPARKVGYRLVAIIDWFSRYVISWVLDDTLERGFVVEVLVAALSSAKPEVWNTDQGRHFTRPQITQLLIEAGIQISMDSKGRASDNICTERFWRLLTYEEMYLADDGSAREARLGIARYIAFYHTEQPHKARDYRRPAERYFG